MNKKLLRKISLIILPLIIIGIATYFLITSNAKEAKASIAVDPSSNKYEFDLFAPYKTWPNSAARKTGTAADWLKTMSDGSPGDIKSIIDINGDGLVDILVHFENANISTDPSIYHFYFGVLLNRGDLTFDFAYKCVYTIESGVKHYYGDCAAI